MPGKATSRPISIDRPAAIRDNWIVAQNPPSRNSTFDLPCGVPGSMTYQPHVPPDPLHPASSKRPGKSAHRLSEPVIDNALVMYYLVQKRAEAFRSRRVEHCRRRARLDNL